MLSSLYFFALDEKTLLGIGVYCDQAWASVKAGLAKLVGLSKSLKWRYWNSRWALRKFRSRMFAKSIEVELRLGKTPRAAGSLDNTRGRKKIVSVLEKRFRFPDGWKTSPGFVKGVREFLEAVIDYRRASIEVEKQLAQEGIPTEEVPKTVKSISEERANEILFGTDSSRGVDKPTNKVVQGLLPFAPIPFADPASINVSWFSPAWYVLVAVGLIIAFALLKIIYGFALIRLHRYLTRDILRMRLAVFARAPRDEQLVLIDKAKAAKETAFLIKAAVYPGISEHIRRAAILAVGQIGKGGEVLALLVTFESSDKVSQFTMDAVNKAVYDIMERVCAQGQGQEIVVPDASQAKPLPGLRAPRQDDPNGADDPSARPRPGKA